MVPRAAPGKPRAVCTLTDAPCALSTETTTGGDAPMLPEASCAMAVSVCAPLSAASVSQAMLQGDFAALAKTAPSTAKSTEMTSVSSSAPAVSRISPATPAPEAMSRRTAVGGVVSRAQSSSLRQDGAQRRARNPVARTAMATRGCTRQEVSARRVRRHRAADGALGRNYREEGAGACADFTASASATALSCASPRSKSADHLVHVHHQRERLAGEVVVPVHRPGDLRGSALRREIESRGGDGSERLDELQLDRDELAWARVDDRHAALAHLVVSLPGIARPRRSGLAGVFRLHRWIELLPGRPGLPAVEVGHLRVDAARGGIDRLRARNSVLRGAGGDHDRQDREQDHRREGDLLQHGGLRGAQCRLKWRAKASQLSIMIETRSAAAQGETAAPSRSPLPRRSTCCAAQSLL